MEMKLKMHTQTIRTDKNCNKQYDIMWITNMNNKVFIRIDNLLEGSPLCYENSVNTTLTVEETKEMIKILQYAIKEAQKEM
jgi:hypothetical protein